MIGYFNGSTILFLELKGKAMGLLFKIPNSFNGVMFNGVIMGPPKIGHSSKNKQVSRKGSISLEFQW